jgi:glycosyltransferase involved in cell wall biosynthesis
MRTTFTARSRPLLATPGVEYIGELCQADKPAFYDGAAATLFPSDRPEPFGLVLIESLAAGTPVVALRRGDVPEIIEHRVSGYICTDADEFATCVERAVKLLLIVGREPRISRSNGCVNAMNAFYEELIAAADRMASGSR